MVSQIEGKCEECGKEDVLYRFKKKNLCYSCYCPDWKPQNNKTSTSSLGRAQDKCLGTVGINRKGKTYAQSRRRA